MSAVPFVLLFILTGIICAAIVGAPSRPRHLATGRVLSESDRFEAWRLRWAEHHEFNDDVLLRRAAQGIEAKTMLIARARRIRITSNAGRRAGKGFARRAKRAADRSLAERNINVTH